MITIELYNRLYVFSVFDYSYNFLKEKGAHEVVFKDTHIGVVAELNEEDLCFLRLRGNNPKLLSEYSYLNIHAITKVEPLSHDRYISLYELSYINTQR